MFGGLILAGGGYPTAQQAASALGGGMTDPSKAAMAGLWSEDRQMELINQYAALNSR